MPRLLAIGHVTWDRRPDSEVLGGAVSYASLAARALGWDAAVATSAGPDFDPHRDLPAVTCFLRRSSATTRFLNTYDPAGQRQQQLGGRASEIDPGIVPPEWRSPEVLLLAPVAGE